MLKSIIKLSCLTCFTLPFMFISPVIYAQSTIPKLDELSSRTRQNIKKTKDIISKTQSKIELIRSQNEIRTREIEGLTTKVGSIITKMSGQGKDNSACISLSDIKKYQSSKVIFMAALYFLNPKQR